MIDRFKLFAGTAAASLLCIGTASAAMEAAPIRWSELRPADQDAGMVVMPAAAPSSVAKGETLSLNLEGRQIVLTGYLLPVDREGDLVYEFLLLPVTGLCSHLPPPPPNQAVHVFPARPYRLTEIYEPVSVSGTLRPEIEKTQLMILDGVSVIESGYRIGKAQVEKADSVRDSLPSRKATPWSFLNKKANSE